MRIGVLAFGIGANGQYTGKLLRALTAKGAFLLPAGMVLYLTVGIRTKYVKIYFRARNQNE